MAAPTPTSFPAPIRATLDDLPPAAAEAIRSARAQPESGRRTTIEAAGIRFSTLEWGAGSGRPLLLVHGVIGSARTFWLVGPALAATGFRVVAPDLPGHGRTGGGEDGRGFAFQETAGVVAAFARIAFAGHRPGDVAVVGHSWGSMLASRLPAAGYRPARIVLLDPPVMGRARIEQMIAEERPHASQESALAAVRAANPDWPEAEHVVEAESLTQFVPAAALAVLLGNGDWDGAVSAVEDPALAGIPVWIVRGEPASGSLTPDGTLPRLAAVAGPDHVLTIAGGPHSPQRTHIEATTLAVLRALEAD